MANADLMVVSDLGVFDFGETDFGSDLEMEEDDEIDEVDPEDVQQELPGLLMDAQQDLDQAMHS